MLSVTRESKCTNYWLTACSSLPRKIVVRLTDRPAMTTVIDWDVKQQNKQTKILSLNVICHINETRHHNSAKYCSHDCHLLNFEVDLIAI